MESKFDGIVSKRDKLQDLNINQLKLEVHDYYGKDEKITTNFEPTDDSDVINKAYLDEKLKKIDGYVSYKEKKYNEFKEQYNKQSVEEILIQRTVKTTIQIFYDKGLFDIYANADKVLEAFLLLRDVGLILRKYMITFNDCDRKNNLKNKATSNIKIQQVLHSIGLNNVSIYLRDGPLESDIGIVNLHPSRGTH